MRTMHAWTHTHAHTHIHTHTHTLSVARIPARNINTHTHTHTHTHTYRGRRRWGWCWCDVVWLPVHLQSYIIHVILYSSFAIIHNFCMRKVRLESYQGTMLQNVRQMGTRISKASRR